MKGAELETLFSEAVCDGAPSIKDAVLVPAYCFDAIIDRLIETPNEHHLNEMLFLFLDRRAPDVLFERICKQSPGLLRREGLPNRWLKTSYHAEILFHARANHLRILPADTRANTCRKLEEAARISFDISFVSNEKLAALFEPLELINLTINIIEMLDNEVPSRIRFLAENADADSDIEDQFSDVESFLTECLGIEAFKGRLAARVSDLEQEILDAKAEVKARKSTEEHDSYFSHVPTADSESSTG